MTRSSRPIAAIALVVLMAGCGRYRVGPEGLYPPGIRTVYVPVFESDSYRPNLGIWLTEAVVKQIESQTPYKVVASPAADSQLIGRILDDRKQSVAENANDEPRMINHSLSVVVSWYARDGRLMFQRRFDLGDTLVPESGQSITTAQQEVIERIARGVAGQMENADW